MDNPLKYYTAAYGEGTKQLFYTELETHSSVLEVHFTDLMPCESRASCNWSKALTKCVSQSKYELRKFVGNLEWYSYG